MVVRVTAPDRRNDMDATNAPTVERRTVLLVAVALAAAAAYWLAGYLPWLLTGLNGSEYLYLVEYDHRSAAPVALPTLGDLLRYGVLGGVCAGLLSGLGGRRRPDVLVASGFGAAAAVVLVHLQSYFAPDAATTDGGGVVVLVILSVAASGAGWALGALSLSVRPFLTLLLGVAAATAPAWLMDLGQIAAAVVGRADLALFSSAAAWWALTVPFLVATLVSIGARPGRWILAWPLVLLVCALTTGTYSAMAVAGILVDNNVPSGEAVRHARVLFSDSLQPDLTASIAYAVAVVIAWAVCHRIRSTRSSDDDRPTATARPHT